MYELIKVEDEKFEQIFYDINCQIKLDNSSLHM